MNYMFRELHVGLQLYSENWFSSPKPRINALKRPAIFCSYVYHIRIENASCELLRQHKHQNVSEQTGV